MWSQRSRAINTERSGVLESTKVVILSTSKQSGSMPRWQEADTESRAGVEYVPATLMLNGERAIDGGQEIIVFSVTSERLEGCFHING